MITNIVNAIKLQAEHIQGVSSFKYEGVDLINQQHNNQTIQIVVEDDIFIDSTSNEHEMVVEMNVAILDNIKQGEDKLDVHNRTIKIALVLMKLLGQYGSTFYITDYNILTLSNYTDDNNFGARISFKAKTINQITICNLDDYIDDEQTFVDYIDNEIKIEHDTINIDSIVINPIKLK